MKRIGLSLALSMLAVAAASAASHYKLTLDAPRTIGETQLKAGSYKVDIVGDKAVFTSGKTTVEVPVKVENSDKKFSLTTVQAVDAKILEIDLGGSTTKLVFSPAAAGSAAGK